MQPRLLQTVAPGAMALACGPSSGLVCGDLPEPSRSDTPRPYRDCVEGPALAKGMMRGLVAGAARLARKAGSQQVPPCDELSGRLILWMGKGIREQILDGSLYLVLHVT